MNPLNPVDGQFGSHASDVTRTGALEIFRIIISRFRYIFVHTNRPVLSNSDRKTVKQLEYVIRIQPMASIPAESASPPQKKRKPNKIHGWDTNVSVLRIRVPGCQKLKNTNDVLTQSGA